MTSLGIIFSDLTKLLQGHRGHIQYNCFNKLSGTPLDYSKPTFLCEIGGRPPIGFEALLLVLQFKRRREKGLKVNKVSEVINIPTKFHRTASLRNCFLCGHERLTQ